MNDDRVQFWVPGVPRAQGSKRHVGHGVMVEMSKDLGPWRDAITRTAVEQAKTRRFHGAVAVRTVFFFNRPASHYGTGKNAGAVKASAPRFRDAAPDLDKLLRALGDALTASALIHDDRHIVEVQAKKMYGDPGVLVEVREVE